MKPLIHFSILPCLKPNYIEFYLCNQYLSPLKFWVRIPLMAGCTWYNILKHFVSYFYRSVVLFNILFSYSLMTVNKMTSAINLIIMSISDVHDTHPFLPTVSLYRTLMIPAVRLLPVVSRYQHQNHMLVPHLVPLKNQDQDRLPQYHSLHCLHWWPHPHNHHGYLLSKVCMT